MIEQRMDPLDFVETALPQCASKADLQFVQDELRGMQREIKLDITYELGLVDDPDERGQLLDFMLMFERQLVAAHQRFVEHLRTVAKL